MIHSVFGKVMNSDVQATRISPPRRRGLSIMEVLFAIAVLTIGLLGVASIIPVASHNAANALQTDRAIEEINNRIATDLANLNGSFTEVLVANNSQDAFANPPGNQSATNAFNPPPSDRVRAISRFELRNHLNQYDIQYAPVTPSNPYPAGQPRLADAYCIDPWFLSAANTLRNDTGADPNATRNGYDRTVYPCYDPRYQPIAASPSDPIADSIAPGQPNAVGTNWDTPRFTRLSIPFDGSNGILSAAEARSSTRRSDDFSLVYPEDRTFAPGLAVQRGGNPIRSLTKNTVSSRYTSFVLLSRSAAGSNFYDAAVVTMHDRKIVTVPGGGPGLAHNLEDYTAANPDDTTGPPPADNQLLYEGEQVGYVSYSDRPFVGGGGGEIEFRTSRFVKPDIGDGDWIMLMRRAPVFDAAAGGFVPGPLKFAWYTVSDVIRGPELITDGRNIVCYETQVALRGPDWVFHPIQQSTATLLAAPYYGSPLQANWGSGAAPAFDFDNMPLNGTVPFVHQNFGTTVVVSPDVISVKRFQVEL